MGFIKLKAIALVPAIFHIALVLWILYISNIPDYVKNKQSLSDFKELQAHL